MPRVSAFYGIVIYMYIRDHAPPHIHAWAAEQRAVIDIATGKVTAGALKARQAALVRDWVAFMAKSSRRPGLGQAGATRPVRSSHCRDLR